MAASSTADCVIVGAGMSGMSTARTLAQQQPDLSVVVVEKDAAPGGRVQTDNVDGFLCDRGFQVFIEEYPMAKRTFDYKALKLRNFLPGALVLKGGEFNLVSDPIRRPQDLLASLLSPIGTFADKLKVGLYRLSCVRSTEEDIFSRPERPTVDFLRNELKLSDSMISSFFLPFYRGIFLAPLDRQSSRMFEWLFSLFARGPASLPEGGMGELARQLASGVKDLRLSTEVLRVERARDGTYVVALAGGETVKCRSVVLATDAPATLKLLSGVGVTANALSGSLADLFKPGLESWTFYWGLDQEAPIKAPILLLNGETERRLPFRINNMCFPSQVCGSYAPAGKALLSVTLCDSDEWRDKDESQVEPAVRQVLQDIWPDVMANAKFLRSYRIRYSQPSQEPPMKVPLQSDPTLAGTLPEGLVLCGDYMSTPTLNGALDSGERAAMCLLRTGVGRAEEAYAAATVT
ncbi:unnamed protein product [Vitrella brassicaformis CCMP3155]|uniref:Amine oxidase n=1 Tax=Vitrella brassicaformis (strain CCMP3155) TaxID=1169540 RepID=A0A0G4EKB7_VITBC|nr:unnamed protein product [Vitrella brassicaformis CCMP3155]|eukprot:CEL97890.1 unnamed protein product [Vitrella brassicaformis CCMP3155]